MVFRKDNKVDAFQRQISALRQQLGTEGLDHEGASLVDARADAGSRDLGSYPMRDVEPHRSRSYDSGPAHDLSGLGLDESPTSLPAPSLDAQTSVVAHDTMWKGDLQTGGSIHLHGRVEGSVEAKDDIYVADEADVNATLVATNVAIAGTVRGSVRCSSRFEVLPQGRVYGDVVAPTLVIHEGAVINGQFRMGAEAEPKAEATPLVRRRAARTGA